MAQKCRICSYALVVAAAKCNGEFANWFHTNHGSSLMESATHDMPSGAEWKNGKAPKKKAKSKQ